MINTGDVPNNWFKSLFRVTKIPTMCQVVAAALIDPAGRVLMQVRAAGRQHAGLWEFPGGKVETDETLEIALVRELVEELAIAVDPADLQLLASAADPAAGIVIFLYTCRRWHGEPVCLDAETLCWFAPADFAQLAMPPLDRPLAAALKLALDPAN